MDHGPGTLEDLEKQVKSPHLTPADEKNSTDKPQNNDTSNDELDLSKLQTPAGVDAAEPQINIDAARDAVAQAMAEGSSDAAPEPIVALNAQPMVENINAPPLVPVAAPEPLSPLIQPEPTPLPPLPQSSDQSMTMPLPPAPAPVANAPAQPVNPNAAPPVPPPIIPFQQ
jgi:hypothetical protein